MLKNKTKELTSKTFPFQALMKTVNPMQAHKFTKNQSNENSLNNTKNEKDDKNNNYNRNNSNTNNNKNNMTLSTTMAMHDSKLDPVG